jgi:hypothetical protein
MPTFTLLDDGWARIYWTIGDRVICEHMICPEAVASFRALCVVSVFLLIAVAVKRWEDWNNEPRHK